MIDLSSVNAVMQRIADIEQKVGMHHTSRGGGGVQEALGGDGEK